LKNSLLVIFSFLSVLCVCEVGLRFLGYHRLSFRPSWLDPSPFVLDPVFFKGTGRNLDWYRRAFKSDDSTRPREGIQVEEDYYPFKPSQKYRVLAVGDSGTFGYGVERNKAWPAVFETLSEKSVEVLNFGVPGALLSDSLYYYRHFLLPYAPDLVLVCLFMANDINQSIYFDERLFNKALHLETLPDRWFEQLALTKLIRLAEMSRWKAKRDFNSYEEEVFVGGEDGTLFAGNFLDGELMLYEKKQRKQIDGAYANVKLLIRHFKRISDSTKSRLVFTIIPSRSFLESTFRILPWTGETLATPEEYFRVKGVESFENLDFSLPLARLSTLMKESKVEFLDYSEDLKKLHQDKSVLIDGDDHLNSFGHHNLARLLSRDLDLITQ